MKLLIFFFAVLTVSCIKAAGAGDNTTCVLTWKYTTYTDKKSCLKTYMASAIKSSSSPVRTKRDATAAPDKTSSPADSPTDSPKDRSTDSSTVNSTDISPAIPTASKTALPLSTKNCSSLDDVKTFFDEKWEYIVNNSAQNLSASVDFKNGKQIRGEILDNLLQKSRLEEFKSADFACFKRTDIMKLLKDKCVIEVLKTSANIMKIPIRISNVMSKPSKIKVDKATCKNSLEVTSCVKTILNNCSSTVLSFVENLESIMTKRCKPLVSLKSTEPEKKGMSTTVIVVIVLVSICGSIAAGFGVYKFLKMRRNRGLHTVTRSAPEECEMTSRIRPQNK